MNVAGRFPRHKPKPVDTRPHAVVIGAGVGGLATGALLGAKGYRVTIIDPLDEPGGRAYAHRQDGFTFDAGPTIITAPWLFEKLWHDCGGRLSDDVELRPNTPFYRVRFDDGTVFDYSGDRAAMEAQIARIEPRMSRAIAAFSTKVGGSMKSPSSNWRINPSTACGSRQRRLPAWCASAAIAPSIRSSRSISRATSCAPSSPSIRC